ncbi:hypothetical protein [Sphingomonas mollis]|uniref:MarR family transcriptional regulator n=1 Tax=Sphingomonas mollis TaxID=2795726 RepID=A0ABS0XNG6_9SPHN|nr:hypothetical protein [Sphingomonas sp. BT553]MBJ6121547.1 hypothetical protein [Sphingomonas sp. BT553]
MANDHDRRSTITDELLLGARQLIAAKRVLAAAMPRGYVHDYAILILYSLYIAAAHDTAMTAPEISAATTGDMLITRRWMSAMESDALVEAVDPAAHPVRWQLTATGIDKATATLMAIARARHICSMEATPPAAATDHYNGRA